MRDAGGDGEGERHGAIDLVDETDGEQPFVGFGGIAGVGFILLIGIHGGISSWVVNGL